MSDRTPTNPAQYQAIVRQTSGAVSTSTVALSTGGGWAVPVRSLPTGTGATPVQGPAYGNLYASGTLVGASTASLTGVPNNGPTATVVSTTNLPRITVTPAVSIPTLLLPTVGQDPPTSLSGIEILDLSTTATEWDSPSICTHPSGAMTISATHNFTDISVFHRPLAGAWGARLDLPNYSAPNGGGAVATPYDDVSCIVALPDGGWVVFAVDANKEIVSWRSAPDEDTSSTVGPRSLAQYVGANLTGFSLIKMRAAYVNGQISVVVSVLNGASNEVRVYASSDLGGSLEYITTIANAGYADVVAWDGGLVLVYIADNAATAGASLVPYARRSANAFDGFSGAIPKLATTTANLMEWASVGGGGAFTFGELSLVADDTGTIWLFGSDHDAAGGALMEGYVQQSLDGGITWTTVGAGVGPATGLAWWRSVDAGTKFKDYQFCAQGSRIVGVAQAAASTGNAADSSLVTFSLGGLTMNPLPQTGTKDPTPNQASGWTTNWAAINLPQNTGATWTATTVGAPGVTMTGLGMRVLGTTLADVATWAAAPAFTLASGARVEARGIRVDVGYFELRARIGDATPRSYDVRVRCTPTTITVTDMNGGGAGVPTTLYTETATVRAVRIWLWEQFPAGPTARVMVDYLSSAPQKIGAGIDEWYTAQTATSVVLPGIVTTDRVSFAFGTTGLVLPDGYVQTVSFGVNGNPGLSSRLLGQPLLPTTSFVGELGLKLAGIGLFPSGATWYLNTEFPYPAANTNPQVRSSPQSGGRFDQAAGVSMSMAGTHDGGIMAVCLRNCNFETATFSYYDPVVAGTVTRTIDLKIGTGLQYTRTGTIIQCDPSAGNNVTDYLPENTLAGATWRFGGGGAIRTIGRNTGGRWSTTATMGTGLRPVLVLEGVDGTEAASGGAGSILSPDVTVLFRNVAAGANQFVLTVAPTSTATGYIEIGKAFVGTCMVFARRTSRGDQHSITTNLQTSQAKDGTRRVVKEGSARRAESMDWVDGIDTTNVHQTSPDYVTSYVGGTVIGNYAATPFDMFGLLASDAENCIVYLPKVPVTAGAANVTTITAKEIQLYGRIRTDTLQMDVVVGNAWTGSAGELVRMGTLLIEEEL